MDLGPARRLTLTDDALARLRQQIVGGALAPGAVMPAEHELAAALGVSRSTIREALRSLVGAGLVERRGKRLIVSSRPRGATGEEDLSELAALISVRDIYETRRVLEQKTAALAAEFWTPPDLDDLRRCLAQIDSSDEEEFRTSDVDFHSTIARMGHNRVLTRVYELSKPLFFRLPDYWRVFGSPRKTAPEIVDLARHSHGAIFDAIRQRDPEAAAKAMLDHLDVLERELQSRIRQPQPVSGSPAS